MEVPMLPRRTGPISDALDAALRATGTSDVCPQCSGPDKASSGSTMLKVGEELQTCPTCGEPVDESGRTLGAICSDGTVRLTVIRLGVDVPSPPQPC